MQESRRMGVFQLKTVTGYIVVPSSQQQEEIPSDEEEEDDDDWLDYSQMKAAFRGGTFVKGNFRRPQRSRVKIQDYNSKASHSCIGRFALSDPWWDLRLQINQNGYAHGLIEYALCSNQERVKAQNLVILALRGAILSALKKEKVKNRDQEANRVLDDFEKFLRKNYLVEKLTFENLPKFLSRFSFDFPDHNFMAHSVLGDDMMRVVLRAQSHPELFRFLCRLFPVQFQACLLVTQASKLDELQTAAREEPWVFGFSAILTRRFSVYSLEAKLKAFETASLLDRIPTREKDALYIYDTLKADQRNGHTYLPFPDLRNHHHWKELSYDVSDWLPALAFLSENQVTVEERFDARRNIFLYHNWNSEVKIAAGLRTLQERAITAKEPMWDVDFASDDLAHLRGDADQWRAVQKVAANPITVLSGKGGCGKTTIVTALLKHVCLRSKQLLHSAAKDADATKAAEDPEDMPSQERNPADNRQQLTPEKASASAPPNPQQPSAQEAKTTSSQSKPDQVSPEQLSSFIERVEKSVREKCRRGREHDVKKEKLLIDLVTDLVKYLGTSGDTAMSNTPAGSRILLTAPTGKAAKLLGHKAKMESCTLHKVIYSYRMYLKAVAQAAREARREREMQQQQAEEDRREREEEEERESREQARKENRNRPGEERGVRGETNGDGKRHRDAGAEMRPEREAKKEADDDETEKEGKDKDEKEKTEEEKMTEEEKKKEEEEDEREAAKEIDPWKYAGVEVLVVDEGSLVSLRTFSTMLTILIENTPLSKLVLLGDWRQLPSIEPGNLLSDMFAVLGERGWGVELTTNHRSESELIVSNATRISRFQMPFFDPQRNFHFCPVEDSLQSADPERDEALRHLLYTRPELTNHETSQIVAFKRSDCDAVNELCCKYYNNHTMRSSVQDGGKPGFDFRVGDKVCFRKNGMVVNQKRKLLTYLKDHPDILQAFGFKVVDKTKKKKSDRLDVTAAVELLTKDDHISDMDVEERDNSGRVNWSSVLVQETEFGIRMETVSQSGEAGCSQGGTGKRAQLKLSDIGQEKEEEESGRSQASQGEGSEPTSSQVKKEGEEEEEGKNGLTRLCNGEIFFILDDISERSGEKEERFLVLSDRDPVCPRVLYCNYKSLRRECHVRHAWARTIHTYQGSESDTVIYYLCQSKAQNWKHPYTAVTRGRKSVFILGKQSHLRQAVWAKDRQRRSKLQRRMRDQTKGLDFTKLHSIVRQINEAASQALSTAAPVAAPCPGTPQAVKRNLFLDSFPDSDDSWVKDMSPVWEAQDRHGNMQMSEDEGDEDGGEDKRTPVKRASVVDIVADTPKRLRNEDESIDSIVSPVRRSLTLSQ